MSSAQRLAFMELKRRLSTLEYQHNILTSICTVLAKQVKELRLQQTNSGTDSQKDFVSGNNNSLSSLNTSSILNNSSKSVEQMFKERLQKRDQNRSTDIREISLSKKTQKTKKNLPQKKSKKNKVIDEPFSEESEEVEDNVENSEDEESEEETEEESEEEEEVSKPVETKKSTKKVPVNKVPVNKVPAKTPANKVSAKNTVNKVTVKTPVNKVPVKTPVNKDIEQTNNITVEIVDSMLK